MGRSPAREATKKASVGVSRRATGLFTDVAAADAIIYAVDHGPRSDAHVHLSWGAPAARTYRLTVSRDGGAARRHQGATTATTADYDLDPGHT